MNFIRVHKFYLTSRNFQRDFIATMENSAFPDRAVFSSSCTISWTMNRREATLKTALGRILGFRCLSKDFQETDRGITLREHVSARAEVIWRVNRGWKITRTRDKLPQRRLSSTIIELKLSGRSWRSTERGFSVEAALKVRVVIRIDHIQRR